MIRWFEKPKKIRTVSSPPQWSNEYGLSGVHKEYEARSIAEGLLPAYVMTSMGLLQRGPLELRSAGHRTWDVVANYGSPAAGNPGGGTNLVPGQFSFSFETMGGTRHIENVGAVPGGAIVGAYGVPGVLLMGGVPDVKGTIGANLKEKRVEGCDVHARGLKFQFTFCHPRGVMTLAKAKRLRDISATVNLNQWGPFEAGSCLFLGANGGDGTQADANCVYHFDSSENVQNLQVGDVVVVEKQGWDFAWVVHRPEKGADHALLIPEFVYVARVYERIDFAAALGFEPTS